MVKLFSSFTGYTIRYGISIFQAYNQSQFRHSCFPLFKAFLHSAGVISLRALACLTRFLNGFMLSSYVRSIENEIKPWEIFEKMQF